MSLPVVVCTSTEEDPHAINHSVTNYAEITVLSGFTKPCDHRRGGFFMHHAFARGPLSALGFLLDIGPSTSRRSRHAASRLNLFFDRDRQPLFKHQLSQACITPRQTNTVTRDQRKAVQSSSEETKRQQLRKSLRDDNRTDLHRG